MMKSLKMEKKALTDICGELKELKRTIEWAEKICEVVNTERKDLETVVSKTIQEQNMKYRKLLSLKGTKSDVGMIFDIVLTP